MMRALLVLLSLSSCAAFRGSFPLGDALIAYRSLLDLENPAGQYYGTKTVLGETINVDIGIINSTQFNFTISGAIGIQCDYEAYTINGNSITVNNLGVDGDCIHDALKEHTITLQSITYDPTSDSITVDVKYTFLSLSVVLTHKSSKYTRSLPSVHQPPHAFAALLDRYIETGFGASLPDGEYDGDKNILGQDIHARVVFNKNSSLNFTITGPLTIDCSYEEYSYAGGVITIPNVGKDLDCLHDALAANGCTLGAFTFDETTNVLSVKVKYHSVVSLTLDLTHKAKATAAPLAQVYRDYMPIARLQDPFGDYAGSKTVIGVTVSGKIELDGKYADLEFSGFAKFQCSGVAYTFSNNVVTIPSVNDPTSCVGAALKKNELAFKSVSYDGAKNIVTVSSVYKGAITINLPLQHTNVLPPKVPTVSTLTPDFVQNVLATYQQNALRAPAGNFRSSVRVFGLPIDAELSFGASSFDLDLAGVVALSCQNQPFTYSGVVVGAPTVTTPGTCLFQGLKANQVTVESFTYDVAEDAVSLVLKHEDLEINLIFVHQ